ncbi:hypothetical protein ABZ128_03440 [Streptomyces sp. NPDC006326]|uniref:hypothetical protein n=1 Tax=Streptomyces sp. NPDC006326 TaxID=3156752 RepID=UPI0033A5D2EC
MLPTPAGDPTSPNEKTGTPTPADIARALASRISTNPPAPPHVVTVSFGLLRGAEARYGSRSSGGSVLGLANFLHAQLYGLPLERPPIPGALDELLQAAGHDADQNLVLDQVATQLEAAAALIERARHQARWQQLPDTVTARLVTSQALAQHLSSELHQLAPAFEPAAASPAPLPALPLPAPAAAVPGRSRI